MSVAVIVPWRGGCPHRERAWEWVQTRYREHHPDWEVIEAGAPRGPWCKAAAVTGALVVADADVLVVADADCWTDTLAEAAHRVRGGGWIKPHHVLRRLTEQASLDYMAGTDLNALETVERPYRGMDGGGIVVLHRDTYERVPLDPRFKGWGGEDESWGHALITMAGRPPGPRMLGQLAHLWHPPQDRLTRRMGSLENEQLRARYAQARRNPDQTRALLEEVTRCRSLTSSRLAA